MTEAEFVRRFLDGLLDGSPYGSSLELMIYEKDVTLIARLRLPVVEGMRLHTEMSDRLAALAKTKESNTDDPQASGSGWLGKPVPAFTDKPG